jgi:hypothetical protein
MGGDIWRGPGLIDRGPCDMLPFGRGRGELGPLAGERRTAHTRGRCLTGWAGTRLDRVLRETGTGNDTLLGAVHANAERLEVISRIHIQKAISTHPTIIVLVQHPDELTGVETEFILH